MQVQKKNTITQNVSPGSYGDPFNVPVVTVDEKGRVTDITLQTIGNPSNALPKFPNDPSLFLNGMGEWASAFSILDFLIVTEDGGLVYDRDNLGNFNFLLKEAP